MLVQTFAQKISLLLKPAHEFSGYVSYGFTSGKSRFPLQKDYVCIFIRKNFGPDAIITAVAHVACTSEAKGEILLFHSFACWFSQQSGSDLMLLFYLLLLLLLKTILWFWLRCFLVLCWISLHKEIQQRVEMYYRKNCSFFGAIILSRLFLLKILKNNTTRPSISFSTKAVVVVAVVK